MGDRALHVRRFGGLLVGCATASLAASACGETGTGAETGFSATSPSAASATVVADTPPATATGPPSPPPPVAATVAPFPTEAGSNVPAGALGLCDAPLEPVVAAYDIETGASRWVVCEPAAPVYRTLVAATEAAVYAEWFETTTHLAAYDASTGETVEAVDVPPNPDPASDRSSDGAFDVDGVTISGGQDDPTSVSGPAGRWTRPGSWVYDDVAAVGDGAIVALDRSDPSRPPRLEAYELETGEVRWSVPVEDPYGEGAWPYLVDGGRLFTLWFELQVRSTTDGAVLWQTDYVDAPPAGGSMPMPMRLTGVRANSTTVFVAFSSAASGGD